MHKQLFKILISALLFFGCSGTIQEKIYLQEVEVYGPVNHPPVRVTQNRASKTVTLSPKLFINSERKLEARINHSKVNADGIFQIDTSGSGPDDWNLKESPLNRYEYKGRNLHWNLPDVYAGLDVDLPVSNSVSIAASVNMSSQNNQDLVGGSVGLGFSSENENSAFRLDFGVSFQEYAFDAETVVSTTYTDYGSKNSDIVFYHDVNKNKDINFYGSLSMNSVYQSSFNYFISLSYFSQTLLDFEPKENNPEYSFWGATKYTTDLRGEASTSFLSICPGVYHNITPSTRVLFGFSLLKNLGMEDISESVIILPVLKFDFMF